MQRSFVFARFASGVLAAAALAACSEQSTEPMLHPSPGARSADVVATAGDYLVLASANSFGSDFARSVKALGGSINFEHQGSGFAVVSGLTPAAAAQLAQQSGIAEVDADVAIALDEPIARAESDMSNVAAPTVESATNPTHAARYSWQWNMRDIHADAAWAAGQFGSADVTVAIIDTGIDYDAPDLNGLVDLSRSASFVPSDNAIRARYFKGRNDVSDFNGHGTNVATQVSSKAFALAGVTSRTTLIGLKALDWTGHGTVGSVLSAVLWAADHGADVANMSLGGAFLKTGNGLLTAELNRVFNYANQQGMLIVVAAGNDGADLDHDGDIAETYCDMVHVVCVSSVGPTTFAGPQDVPAFYTNFGRSAITVAGPGGNAQPVGSSYLMSHWPWGDDIASWVWSYCSKTTMVGLTKRGSPVLTDCQAGNLLTGFIGTSQATPHVAGLAALLVSLDGHNEPQQIKQAIVSSADDLGEPGTDPFFGRGRINVAKAIVQ